MGKKLPVFTYEKLHDLIDDASDMKTVSAVVILAIDTFRQKGISAIQYGALFELAADRIFTISGYRI